MTQMVNDPRNSSQKRGRPGQRKQERLLRQARRRRRNRLVIGTVLAIALIVGGVFAIWQYQRVLADQQAAASRLEAQQGTATAVAKATKAAVAGTASANTQATALAQGIQTVTAGGPLPNAGPDKPPAVAGSPVTLPSGVKYIDVKDGSGPAAQQGSSVSVEYTGWLESNGQKFDSSYDHGGQPFTVTPLGQAGVITGWNEGLVGIKAGGTRRLIIPPDQAYGARGSGPIPPNATLIFDVSAVLVR